MNFEDVSLKVEFTNSKEKQIVSLVSLVDHCINFLENYGEPDILGKDFCTIIGAGDGETKLIRLLKSTGYGDNAHGFFKELVQILERTNHFEAGSIVIKDVQLPYLLLHSMLEVLIPGNKFIKIKSVWQLEKLTNTKIHEKERADLQRVIELYPVRLSLHVIRQMRLSGSIAYQFFPFVDELSQEGTTHTWVGQFHRGIVEQMYRNRVIFLLNMACPVYCRFCFRKHKECRNQKAPKQEHVKNAIIYVKNTPDVKEILLTGGDPFMNKATLTYAIDGLKDIPHVQTLRIATRSISYYPYLFYHNNSFWINYLKRKYLELDAKGKRIEVATHFIHPDEISIDSLDIITELTQSGIPVYVQTPLLGGCNDEGNVLTELFTRLRAAGAEMHYIFIPSSPIKGNRRYVTPISTGIQLASYLRAHLSDRAIPRISTATKIGKIDWNSSGWAVETDKDDDKFIWIRTPYTLDYFGPFTPILQLQKTARVNSEGTLDVKFMADIGDKNLLWGSRTPRTSEVEFPPKQRLTKSSHDEEAEALTRLQETAREEQRFRRSIVPTGSTTLFRTHKTRVELDLDAEDEEMKKNISYIQNDENITDVVVSKKTDVISSIYRVKNLIKKLAEIQHVTSFRLRSHAFNYKPELYTHTLLKQLAKLNDISIVDSSRIEIETQFLHSDEFTSKHKEMAGKLRQKGITVYNCTPLLPFINDNEDEIVNIAYNCREAGIEFHHIYIAGLPIQSPWNEKYPLDISKIIDLATHVRRYESGRGVPRFMIRTVLGEVDFGLTSEVMRSDEQGRVFVKLIPYSLEYFKRMDSEFDWSEDVTFENDERPIVLVPGLKRSPDFLFD